MLGRRGRRPARSSMLAQELLGVLGEIEYVERRPCR
jgi:hypothetical protein